MTFIDSGSFIMGSDTPLIPQDGEGPSRQVSLNAFYLDIHEVSNAEFMQFVMETEYVTEVIVA
jgi:sulfatase modifying factor 1